MKIFLSNPTQSANDIQSDAVVVVSIKDGKLLKTAKKIDAETAGALSRAVKATGFQGQLGHSLRIPAPQNLNADNAYVLGLEYEDGLDEKCAVYAGRSLTRLFNSSSAKTINVHLDGLSKQTASELARNIAMGAMLEAYTFDAYKTNSADTSDRKLNFIFENAENPDVLQALKERMNIASGEGLARDLGNTPPNDLYPENFAKVIQDSFQDPNIKVKVLDEQDLAKEGMGSMLAVGQGSDRPPRLVVIEYQGSADPKQKPLALVGKGITFDSGGLSLKSNGGLGMKFDMSGAGTVVGAMKAITARKAKANVVAVVALAENMPSARSYRPDDVLKSMSGKTVEVCNTDAEGRLVLNDALTYVQKYYDPSMVVDLATLTGAVMSALGSEFAGLFSNDNDLAAKLTAAGETVDQKTWRLPVGGGFASGLQSQVADIRHTGGRAGASVAASFLQAFVDEGRKWAHLDIAGVANKFNKATGYGVRLLDRFIADNCEDRPTPPKQSKPSTGRLNGH